MARFDDGWMVIEVFFLFVNVYVMDGKWVEGKSRD